MYPPRVNYRKSNQMKAGLVMSIESSLPDFYFHLKENKPLLFSGKRWQAPHVIIRYLLPFLVASKANIGLKLLHAIDRFELQGKWRQPKEKTINDMQMYIECVQLVVKQLNRLNPKEKELREELKMRVDILKERLGQGKKIDETRANAWYKKLEGRVEEWAKNRWNTQEKDLTASQKAQIEKLRQHPLLMKRILHCDALFQRFVHWNLTYQCGGEDSIEIFQSLPGLTHKLMKSELHRPIGYHGGLKLEKDKTVSLRALLENHKGKLEQGKVNLLSPKEKYRFKNGYECSTAEILRNFSKFYCRGNIRETHFVYEGDGIQNFNPYQHGSWNPESKDWKKIDLTDAHYYEHLPKFYKKYDKEALEENYHTTIKAGEWLVVLEAGRDSNKVEPGNSHAWIKIFKPTDDDQMELLMAFSQAAKANTNSILKQLKIFMGTVLAGICMHEPRIYDQEQQFGGQGFSIPEEKADVLLDSVRQILQKAEKEQLYYQVVGNNCFQFAVDFTRNIVGKSHFQKKCKEEDLKISALDFPFKIIQPAQAYLKGQSRLIQKFFLDFFASLFGCHRVLEIRAGNEVQKISVASHSTFAKNGEVYAPHRFIELKQGSFI